MIGTGVTLDDKVDVLVADKMGSAFFKKLDEERITYIKLFEDPKYGKGVPIDELAALVTKHKPSLLVVRSATGGKKKGLVDERVFSAYEGLKGVVRAGDGLDNIDMDAATKRKIQVANVRGANTASVVQLTKAAVLCLYTGIPQVYHAMLGGTWAKDVANDLFEEIRGNGLKVATIGYGNIGKPVAQEMFTLGFDEVLVVDKFPPSEADARKAGVRVVDLETALKEADVILLHPPSTPETYNLINADRLEMMRQGVRIVNTSRGDIIDSVALADAIRNGKVKGAFIDVWKNEPPFANPKAGVEADPLLAPDLASRVIYSAHKGSGSKNARGRIDNSTAESIINFMRTGTLSNVQNAVLGAPSHYIRLGSYLGSVTHQLFYKEGPQYSFKLVMYGGLKGTKYQEIIRDAVLAAFLKPFVPDITLVTAYESAKQKGIDVKIVDDDTEELESPRIGLELSTNGTTHSIEAKLDNEKEFRLTGFGETTFDLRGEGHTYIVVHDGRLGIAGAIQDYFGKHGVYIKSSVIAETPTEEGVPPEYAVAVLNVKGPLPKTPFDALDTLKRGAIPGIKEVLYCYTPEVTIRKKAAKK
ncbi:TPA: hypothetical protein HA246_05850 [Candidatus Woesearchaeota archaeon]|nr:hypothetical protein [Candidatus Woesearchaeota archaeon]